MNHHTPSLPRVEHGSWKSLLSGESHSSLNLPWFRAAALKTLGVGSWTKKWRNSACVQSSNSFEGGAWDAATILKSRMHLSNTCPQCQNWRHISYCSLLTWAQISLFVSVCPKLIFRLGSPQEWGKCPVSLAWLRTQNRLNTRSENLSLQA